MTAVTAAAPGGPTPLPRNNERSVHGCRRFGTSRAHCERERRSRTRRAGRAHVRAADAPPMRPVPYGVCRRCHAGPGGDPEMVGLSAVPDQAVRGRLTPTHVLAVGNRDDTGRGARREWRVMSRGVLQPGAVDGSWLIRRGDREGTAQGVVPRSIKLAARGHVEGGGGV